MQEYLGHPVGGQRAADGEMWFIGAGNPANRQVCAGVGLHVCPEASATVGHPVPDPDD